MKVGHIGAIAVVLTGLASTLGASAAPSVLSFVEAEFDNTGLRGASDIAISPDGVHAYVTGSYDNTLVVFRRNPSTGALTFVEKEQDGVSSVDGLGGAIQVAISPDGMHLYAVGSLDNTVAVFSRDAPTGALSFVEVQRDGVNGVDGLDNPTGISLSPEGSHVYVTGFADDALTVFHRNAVTGALSYAGMYQDGLGGIDGLDGASAVSVSPDGRHVYVGGGYDDALAVFNRNRATGMLTYAGVYRDTDPGLDGLDRACALDISPDGHHIYVTGCDDNAVASFGRNATTGALTFIGVEQDGIGGVDGLHFANSVTISADGYHLYVTAYHDNAVAVFSRNPTTGALTFVQVRRDGVGDTDNLRGASAAAASPDGANVYVAGAEGHAVTLFGRDVSSGGLTLLDVQRNIDGLHGATAVTLSPDGLYVYATGAHDDAVSVFGRGGGGRLSYVEMEKDGVGAVDGLDYASFAVVSPDGGHVYVAGSDDNAIAGFRRDEATGALSFIDLERDDVGGIDGLWGARCIAISPDGRHIYAAGYHDDGVAIFSRFPATGNLNFNGRVKNSDSFVDGLDGASYVAVSPDGTNVYAVGHNDNAVVVFGRDAGNGALTFLEMVQDGVDGVDGLWGAQGVTVSPDGRHVYATGFFDRAVAVFSRALTTGRLTFVEMEQHVDVLDGAQSLAVSPDGRYVYVTGYVDDALTVFGRDADSGTLTYVETNWDDTGEVNGLDGTSSVAISPDGQNVYVTGFNDSALAVFVGQRQVYLPLIVKLSITHISH